MRAGFISYKEVEHRRSKSDVVHMGHCRTGTVPCPRTDILPGQQRCHTSLRHYRRRLIPEGRKTSSFWYERGVLASEGWQGFWQPSFKVQPGAFNGHRLSLRFNSRFPGEPGLAGIYSSNGWWRWWWQEWKTPRGPPGGGALLMYIWSWCTDGRSPWDEHWAGLFNVNLCLFSLNWMAPWKNRTSRYISSFPPITQWCYISDVLFT